MTFFFGGGKRESQADKQPPPSKKHIHDLIFHRLEEKQKTPWFCQGVLGCSFTDLGVLAAFGGSLLGLVIFVYPGSASGGGWGLGGLGDAIFSGRSMVRMTQIQTCGNLVGIYFSYNSAFFGLVSYFMTPVIGDNVSS